MAVKLTEEMIKAAQEAESKYGIPASITLAQIRLESGDGKGGTGLSSLAKNYNNLFGQKAGEGEKGVTLQTTEYIQGKPVATSAKFKVYDSIEESILDHGKKWGTSRVGKQNSIEEYADALVKKGYATSPSYSSLLLDIIKEGNLTQYDGAGTSSMSIYDESEESGIMDKIKSAVLPPILQIIFVIFLLVIAVIFFAKSLNAENPITTVTKKVKKKVRK